MATYFAPGRGNTWKTIVGKDGKKRKVKGGYRYDFELFGHRYAAPRGFDRKSDSDDAERELRRRVMLQHAGVVVTPADLSSPRFANWAGVYRAWVNSQAKLGRLKRPDIIDANISSVLRFCGRKPTAPNDYVHPTGLYLDLTLADFCQDPSLIRRWEQWLTDEGLAGSTRNHYNTTMSEMYKLALLAEYRDASGPPAFNPFRDRPRAKWKRRTKTLTADDIQRWIHQASYHARLAIAIATLNPKFRLKNVLQLEWSDVDFDQALIRVWDHKTDSSGEALVAAMPEQLLRILEDARTRHPHATRVILYHGRPVKSIDSALKSAAIAADLPWGRSSGVTFHSIRHFASTQMARLQIPPDHRQNVTGRRDVRMEMWYTHLFPEDGRVHAERLSAAVPIAAAVTAGRLRVHRPKAKASDSSNTATAAPVRPHPGLFANEVGKSDAVGTTVGSHAPKQGDLGRVGSLKGLRRGPLSRAERAAKLLVSK